VNVVADIEYRNYAEALAQFIRQQGTLLPKALRVEGRQLASRVMRFTPPGTRAEGRRAVARDIQRALRPLRVADFESPRIRQLIRQRDYAGLEAVFQNFPDTSELQGVKVVEARLPEMHQEARRSRGRVLKFQRRVTPDADVVRSYIKETQEHVGRGRSGWAVALIALGGKAPAWVVRHAKADTGEFEDRVTSGGYLRMENTSEWAEAGDEDRVVENAIRSRARSIREAIARAQAEAIRKARLN
jgi:hypothetical protein